MKDFNSADFERLKDIYYAEAYNLAFALLGESDSAAKITELSLSDAAKYSYNERKFHKKLISFTVKNAKAATPAGAKRAKIKRNGIIISIIALIIAAAIVCPIVIVNVINTSKIDYYPETRYFRLNETATNELDTLSYPRRKFRMCFTEVSAVRNIDVNGTAYEGFYLILSGEIYSSKCFFNFAGWNSAIFSYKEGATSFDGFVIDQSYSLRINQELTLSLSEADLDSGDVYTSDIYVDGSFSLVYDLTQEQYDLMYSLKDTYNLQREEIPQADIHITINELSYKSILDEAVGTVFIFFYHEINFEEELQ